MHFLSCAIVLAIAAQTIGGTVVLGRQDKCIRRKYLVLCYLTQKLTESDTAFCDPSIDCCPGSTCVLNGSGSKHGICKNLPQKNKARALEQSEHDKRAKIGCDSAFCGSFLATGSSVEGQSGSIEKRAKIGCDSAFCGSFLATGSSVEDWSGSIEKKETAKEICKVFGARGECLRRGPIKEKRDNTGCDNSHCIPAHALGGQKLSRAIEERVYCYLYGPHGRCLQSGDDYYKAKKDNTGCDNFHCIPPHALGGRSNQPESLETRNHICKDYSPNGTCLRYGFDKEDMHS